MNTPLVLTWCSEEMPGFCCGDGVSVFVNSLRRNVEARLVVFTDNLPPDAREWLLSAGAEIVDVPRHNGVYRTRHLRFANYLQSFSDDRQILACDCKDVVFQSDPFKHRDFPRFIGFVAEGQLIGKCDWNNRELQGVVHRVPPDGRCASYDDCQVLCAGTILGSLRGMRLAHACLWAANNLSSQSTDQGVLNYVYHTALASNPDVEVLDPHTSTLVGTADWTSTPREAFAIWHQWDRSLRASEIRRQWSGQ